MFCSPAGEDGALGCRCLGRLWSQRCWVLPCPEPALWKDRAASAWLQNGLQPWRVVDWGSRVRSMSPAADKVARPWRGMVFQYLTSLHQC